MYDSLNRLTQINFSDNTAESRGYDNVGNLASRTTQNNTIINYIYDEINRLTKITYPDGSTVTYVYDKDSNRLQMFDSLHYELHLRPAQPPTIGNQNHQRTASRVTGVGTLASLTYRKNNQLASVSYGNGVQAAYAYDQLGRIARIHTWNSTSTLLDLNYAYDPNGNPTSVNSGQETYGYDDVNRLTSASGPFGTLSYSYDQVGNRLSAVVNGTTTSYSYGSYNKLLSAGSTTYTYDSNGNMIAKNSGSNLWTYTYDPQNRLKQAKLSGQQVFQALYDGDGRRIQTVAGDTTVYHYQAGSWGPTYVKDLSAGVTTDVIFAGGFRVGKIQGGVSYYYHLDRLGSVQLVTQTANLQTFTSKYLPYGPAYATSGADGGLSVRVCRGEIRPSSIQADHPTMFRP